MDSLFKSDRILLELPDAKIICFQAFLKKQGTTQHFWKHQIPKTSKSIGPRINLIFRKIE